MSKWKQRPLEMQKERKWWGIKGAREGTTRSRVTGKARVKPAWRPGKKLKSTRVGRNDASLSITKVRRQVAESHRYAYLCSGGGKRTLGKEHTSQDPCHYPPPAMQVNKRRNVSAALMEVEIREGWRKGLIVPVRTALPWAFRPMGGGQCRPSSLTGFSTGLPRSSAPRCKETPCWKEDRGWGMVCTTRRSHLSRRRREEQKRNLARVGSIEDPASLKKKKKGGLGCQLIGSIWVELSFLSLLY